MDKQIVFNCLYDENKKCPSVQMKTVHHHTMLEIKNFSFETTDSKYWPAIQLFNSPARVSNLNQKSTDWQYWNGCVFVDVDLKHLSDDELPYPVGIIMSGINAHLVEDNNLYACQLSKSGKGLHYIFYFNVEKTYVNFKKCATYAQDRIRTKIKHRFGKLYQKIEEYDRTRENNKIMDDCSLRPAQLLIMTSYPLCRGENIFNKNFGDIDLNSLPNRNAKLDESLSYTNGLHTNVLHDNTQWDISHAQWDGNYGSITWNEGGCWPLATFLCLIGMDYPHAHQIFYDMFHLGYKDRKSDWRQIEKEFNTAWNRAGKYDIKQTRQAYIDFAQEHLNIFRYENSDDGNTDQKRLDDFIISHEGHGWPYLPFVPDKIINLQDSEYIGQSSCRTQIENVMNIAMTNQVYIKAGCGTGKTKFILDNFQRNKKAIVVCHLNSIKNANYDTFFRKNSTVNYSVPTTDEIKQMIKNGRSLPDHLLLGWNQFAYLLSSVTKDDLKKYIIYIDEAHALQREFSYRKDNISTIVYNIGKVHNLWLFSATPGAEHSLLLKDENALKIEIIKPIPYTIEYHCIENKAEHYRGKAVDAIANFIRTEYIKNPYNVFAVLDNRHHKEYDILLDDISYIRLCKEESETDEIKKILSSQILGKRILVSTNYGKEGIEFQDEIQNLIVIVPQYRDITRNDVEQFINRFRHKKNVQVFFFQVNPLSDQTDIELLQKGRCLVSGEAVADERLPELLKDFKNRFIMEATMVDLEDAIKDKRNEPLLKLVSYYIDDTLTNNIGCPANLKRLYNGQVQMREMIYDTRETDKVSLSQEKKILSDRKNVERYIAVSLSLNGIIREMITDGLLQFKEDNKKNTQQIIEQMFSVDALFYPQNNNNERVKIKLNNLDL